MAEKKEFLMTISTDFKNVNELQDALQSMSALQKLEGGAMLRHPFREV